MIPARYCDQLVLLDHGRIACSGPSEDVPTAETLEPVDGIAVRRLAEPDCIQLIFKPLH